VTKSPSRVSIHRAQRAWVTMYLYSFRLELLCAKTLLHSATLSRDKWGYFSVAHCEIFHFNGIFLTFRDTVCKDLELILLIINIHKSIESTFSCITIITEIYE